MKLYKFRSLSNLEFVLDALLSERLFCANYSDLNDPFEGMFASVIQDVSRLANPQFGFGFGLIDSNSPRRIHHNIDNLLSSEKTKSRVCSLSSSLDDVRLWAHYGDCLRGIAIEVDFAGHEQDAIKVNYTSELRHFALTLLSEPTAKDVLGVKTKHWEYESEYRIISNQPYYSVPNRITAVFCGTRVADEKLQFLRKIVPNDIPIYKTDLDKDSIKIRPGKEID